MILIGTDEGIYRWFNGIGWPVYHSLQDRVIRSMAASGGGVVAVLDGANRVLESVDNGMTWRVLPLPESAGRPAALSIVGPMATLLLGTKPLSLQKRLVGAPVPSTLAQAVDRAKSAIQARTGGMTAVLAPPAPATANSFGWTTLHAPKPAKDGLLSEVRALATVPGTQETWLAALTGAGLWKTSDAGANWTKCEGLPEEVFSIRSSAGTIVVGTSNGIWVSKDEGSSWVDTSAGLENARHVRVVEIKPGMPTVMIAGASPLPGSSSAAPRDGLKFALYESADAGKTWSKMIRGLPDDLGYDSVSDIRFDPAATENIVIALGSGELWVSRNGGEYWAPLARAIKSARSLAAF